MSEINTSDSSDKKRMIWIASDKGGVGKTFFAKNFIECLRHDGKAVAAYDADGNLGSLFKALGQRLEQDQERLNPIQDPLVGVGFYNIRLETSRNLLLDCVGSGYPLIVHDLAGGCLQELTRIADNGDGIEGLMDAVDIFNYRVTIVHLITTDHESVESVKSFLDLFENRVDHVVIKNRAGGVRSEDFPYWIGYRDKNGIERSGKTRKRLIDCGGIEIEMPSLYPPVVSKIKANRIPITVIDNRSVDLSVSELANIARFRKEFWLELKKAGNLLGV